MALFVTGVGALIHLYSVGYMHGDEKLLQASSSTSTCSPSSCSMLVMGDNLLVTFLGWEGVGLCSYFS